jgi:GMP synthase-like glutamine amidotransferase
MILIVDMNYKKDSLGFDEFVLPLVAVAEKLDNCFVKHFSEITPEELRSCDRAVLSGTSLQDHETLHQVEKFSWVKTWGKPILGVCAGMQTIGLVFGLKLFKCVEIGMMKVTTLRQNPLFTSEFRVFELHNYSVSVSDDFEVLAESDICIQAIKHKHLAVYGVLFHPEVRNQGILERFITPKT